MSRKFKARRIYVDIKGDLAVLVRMYCKANGIEYRFYIRNLVEKDMMNKLKGKENE